MHEPSQGANAQTVARSVYLAAIGGAIVVGRRRAGVRLENE